MMAEIRSLKKSVEELSPMLPVVRRPKYGLLPKFPITEDNIVRSFNKDLRKATVREQFVSTYSNNNI